MKYLPRLLALTIGIAPAAAAFPAAAQVQNYYHSDAWTAFSGRNPAGTAVCGISTSDASNTRDLSIRFDIGGTATTFSASKPDWSIPDDTHVTVVMQVGLNLPWTAQATGHGRAIDWTLDTAAIQPFDRQFRSSASMTLTFPDGNEPPWALSLAGSTAISDTFGRCIRDLTRQAQSNPPPAAAAAPPPQNTTQPFSTSEPPAAH